MRKKPNLEKPKKKYKIRSKKPWFFWHTCSKCHYSVRRERIWVIEVDWYTKKASDFGSAVNHSAGTMTDVFTFCTNCFYTKMEAVEYFEKFHLNKYISVRYR